MIKLTSEQFQFVHFYFYLLNTVEEGFEYLIDSFNDLELTEGDQIFKDILSAFYHIDSSHSKLESVFTNDEDLLDSLKKGVIMTLENETTIFITPEQYNDYVKNQLAPAYLNWKETIQNQLQPYIIH